MKRYYMNEVFAKNNGSFEFDSVESDYNVYTSVKDSTLSVEKFYKVLQLLNYSKLMDGTEFTFQIAEKDTIRGFVGSSMDEDKNNIILDGHYLIATFESWEYFHRMDENFEVMNFEYIYLHMIDGTWKILIKVY